MLLSSTMSDDNKSIITGSSSRREEEIVDDNQQSVIIHNETKHIVVSSWFEFDWELSPIVEMTELQQTDNNGNTLLHMTCCFGDKSDTTILNLIRILPILVKQPNNYGCYPLHIASYFRASQNVLLKLIEIFPDAAALKDKNNQSIWDSINYDCKPDIDHSGNKGSEVNEIDNDTQQRHDVTRNDDDDDGVTPPPVDIVYVIDNDGTTEGVDHGHINNARSTIGIIGGDADDESNSNDTNDSASIIANDDDSYDDRYRYDDEDDEERQERIITERNEKVNSLVQLIVSSALDAIQQKDNNGNYLLHIACRHCSGCYGTGRDYEEVILKLIELYPIAATQANKNGCFPLHIACCFGASEKVLIKLIEVYPEAVTIKYYVTIDSILDGFLMHDNDNDGGNFPSNIAFRFYKTESSWNRYEKKENKLMDKLMTNINKFNDGSVGIGFYPLHMTLRDYDPSKNVVMKMIKIFPQAVTVPCLKDDGTQDDYALHLVCSKMSERSKTVIRTLIELYPQAIHEMNHHKQYPIHVAFDESRDNKVIKLLLEADPISVIQQQDRNGDTPLHIASCQRKYKFRTKYIPSLKYMVQHSDNIMINISNDQWKTPLHQASTYGYVEIVAALLEHPGINVNAVDEYNETPLHKICSICPIVDKWSKIELYEIVKILINHPFIDIDHKNNSGMTPRDVLKEEMKKLEHQWENRSRSPYDNSDIHDGIQLLPACIKTMELLEEFSFKQRCDAYSFHLSHFVDL